jgi:phosphoribosylamine--glycine ligase
MGDPETQVVLPLLKTDLLDVIEAVVEHRLDQLTVNWHDETAVCVVMTSGGYPGAYQTGRPIQGLPTTTDEKTVVFHAGTRRTGAEVVTAGGRVLGITGRGKTLTDAQEKAYRVTRSITFEGSYYRTDIAHRALSRDT